MSEKLRRKIITVLFFPAAAGFYICLILFGGQVRESVRSSLATCFNAVVPSLFPQLVLTGLLRRVGVPKTWNALLFYPFSKLTGLPYGASECVFFGLTGGYPVGVKTAAECAAKGTLPPAHARRAALICVHPGAAFCVLTVGRAFFGSECAGALLYTAVLLADLLFAFVLARVFPLPPAAAGEPEASPALGDALIGAVTQASGGMVSICAWIAAFSAFTCVLETLLPLGPLSLAMEVTEGVKTACARNSPVSCAFLLGFGGVCVCCQMLPDLRALRLPVWHFLAARAACGGLSALFYRLLAAAFRVSAAAFSNTERRVRFTGGSFTGSAWLFAVCILFMITVSAPAGRRPVKKRLPYPEFRAKM